MSDSAVVDVDIQPKKAGEPGPLAPDDKLPPTGDVEGDDRFALSDDHPLAIRTVRLTVDNPELRRMDTVEVGGGGGGESMGGGLRRDRPFSASVASRRSTTSTKSRVSLHPTLVTTEFAAKNMFCYRTSAIERAVEECKQLVVQSDVDGEVSGYWLLTEIDHWDMEKERLVLLTAHSLLVIKYDFIALKPRSCKRVLLSIVTQIEIGDFVYPRYSIMPSRQRGGLRVSWGATPPSLLQRWNPFCENVGFLTLTHHLLAYNEREKETVTFDVADLSDSVIAAVGVARKGEGPRGAEERPIVIESYASVTSMVYNQSHLGYSMERGGVSF